MPNKSIIDVQVNDEQFKAFYDLFQEYQKHLGSMPDDWRKIDQATKKAAKSFQSGAAGTLGILAEIAMNTRSMAEGLKKATHAQKQFGAATRGSANQMKKMAGYAAHLSKSIFGIGKYLFKVGALGGGISLLGGFGLRELGESAVRGQQEARGLNLNVGQVRAWRADMSRYLSPGILQNVANAQNSFQGRVWLSRATGMSQGAITAGGPDTVALRLALRAHDWWKNTPAALRTAENLQATGFPQSGLTLNDMRRLGRTSRATLLAGEAQYRGDIGSFNLDRQTVTAWYKFTNELARAGTTIETVLTKRLSELAPYLAKFVNVITDDAKALINSTLTPEALKKFGSVLQDVATYLGSKEFRQQAKNFGEAIVDVTNAILWAAKKIDSFFPHKASEGPSVSGKIQTPITRLEDKIRTAQMRQLSAKYGLPAGLLNSVYSQESARGAHLVSPKGAIGPFQLMASTARQYGVSDRMNFDESANAAARMYRDLLRKYKGNVREALAAYNWGQGNVDADIAAHGARWEAYAPKETRDYINKITTMLAKQQSSTKIIISNHTAARVAVQTNAAGF